MASFDYTGIFLVAVTVAVFFIPILMLFPPVPVEHSDALQQTHSKLGIRDKQSNLATQYDDVHTPQAGGSPTVRSLFIYPVKSCRGIELSRSKVVPTGLEYDRQYLFAQQKPKSGSKGQNSEDDEWEFLTLRQLPLLANVHVEVWFPDPAKASRQLGRLRGAFLLIKFPWQDKGVRGAMQLVAAKLSRGMNAAPEKTFLLPLEFPSKREIDAEGYTFTEVRIWKDTPVALDMSKELPRELAVYLGAKNRLGLFRADPSSQRKVMRCAPREETLGYQPIVEFQDAYPLHLLSLASIQALESNIQKDESIDRLDARRFRGNIIVSGTEAYEEDEWQLVQFRKPDDIETVCQFDVSCRTVRCKLPNVDPANGIRHRVEPDHALRKYRDVDEGAPKMGCMGMQLCPVFPEAKATVGTVPPGQLESFIEVGMELEVLRRGRHVYIKQ